MTRYPTYLLYRRLQGEFGEPVYRPVRAGSSHLPAQCELDVDEAVEIHQVDDVGSLPVARVWRTAFCTFVEEAPHWETQSPRAQFERVWGAVIVDADRTLVHVP